MKRYTVELTRDEIITVLAGLSKEARHQLEQGDKYLGRDEFAHFRAYHRKLYRRADALRTKLIRIDGLAADYMDYSTQAAVLEPEFVIAVAMDALHEEREKCED